MVGDDMPTVITNRGAGDVGIETFLTAMQSVLGRAQSALSDARSEVNAAAVRGKDPDEKTMRLALRRFFNGLWDLDRFYQPFCNFISEETKQERAERVTK